LEKELEKNVDVQEIGLEILLYRQMENFYWWPIKNRITQLFIKLIIRQDSLNLQEMKYQFHNLYV